MIPAAIHRSHVVEPIVHGAIWIERCGWGAIVHATSADPIIEAAEIVGISVAPRMGPNGVLTQYITRPHVQRVERLLRASGLPHVVGVPAQSVAANDGEVQP